jgi:hypothetical protein
MLFSTLQAYSGENNSKKSIMVDQVTVNQLQQLVEGLVWTSETDSPFETFVWERVDSGTFRPQDLLHHLGYAPNTPIESQSLEKFFTPVLQGQDWRDEVKVKQYQAVMNYLQDNLRNVQVYRIGKMEMDMYILGQTAVGNVGACEN